MATSNAPGTASPLQFSEVFEELNSSADFTAGMAERVFSTILSGAWSSVQIAGFLVGLRMKGETPEIVTAAARAMRANMIPLEHSCGPVFDTCGTGGDGHNSVNISTGAAIVVAAAGVVVAKHGNRAASSKSGTADVLEELGIRLDLPPAKQAQILKDAGIAFLFARAHHPAMKYAGPPRADLKIRTIFNILGPLCNPARASHQLVGAFSHQVRPLMANALCSLGVEKAWVVHGDDGLDEVSPFGPTQVSCVEGGKVSERTITPETFGLKLSSPGAIDGGDAAFNADVMLRVLRGESHRARAAFVLNAAACLVVAQGLDPIAAAEHCEELLDNGQALALLQKWRSACDRATC